MVGKTGKTTNWLDEQIEAKITAAQESQWGEIDAEIVDFDATKQTATVKPLYKPRHNGKVIEMPNLLEVPVRFQRAGNGAVTFPVKAGNKVTLRPKMRSTDKRHSEGDFEATDARFFSLADMEAYLDGGESVTDPIKNFDNQNMHIRADEEGNFGVKLSGDGKVAIDGKEGNIYDLLAQVVEQLAKEKAVVASGSSSGLWDLQGKAIYSQIAAKLRAMVL